MSRPYLRAFLVAVLAVITVRAQTNTPALRFHHLHYRVENPGAALGDAADKLEGVRTILQGVGVGVRVGREYVFFDRLDANARRDAILSRIEQRIVTRLP